MMNVMARGIPHRETAEIMQPVQPYLEINELVMRHGARQILDIEHLTINRGEVLAVIGPNGSGKSTLLRLIAHLERPNSGNISFIEDTGAASDLDIRRRLAMVFQEPLLFKGTVFDNIAYGLKARKVEKHKIEQEVRGAADMLRISHLLHRPANKISGGEAQRVSLARAFILKPELLLLDEPMASLDPPTREALLADLHRIFSEHNMAVVYVTHELTEALILAKRWAVMGNGAVVQVGLAREVMQQPVNREIADFVGVENIIEGDILAASQGVARVKVNGSEIEAIYPEDVETITGKVWMLIRPENVTISKEQNTQKTSARNRLMGVVETILDVGALYRVVVNCGFPLAVLVTRPSLEEMDLRVGDRVWASFKATGVHIVSRESERDYSNGKCNG